MSAPPCPVRRRMIGWRAATGAPRDDPDATGLTKPPNKNDDTPDEYAAHPTSTKEPPHDGNEEPNDPTAVPHHRRIVDPLRRERGSGRPRPAAEPVAREPVRLRADVGATGRTRASGGGRPARLRSFRASRRSAVAASDGRVRGPPRRRPGARQSAPRRARDRARGPALASGRASSPALEPSL